MASSQISIKLEVRSCERELVPVLLEESPCSPRGLLKPPASGKPIETEADTSAEGVRVAAAGCQKGHIFPV
jgi:hypothetical protein